MAEGGPRPQCRPGAERGGATGRRAADTRNRGICPGRILEDRARSSPATGNAESCRKLAGEWHHFLTHTGNGERTKQEREKWISEQDAFVAELVELAGKKFEVNNKEDARKAAELLGFLIDKVDTEEDAEAKGSAKNITTFTGRLDKCPEFAVRSIEKKRTTNRPPAPFITSTLQQAASSRLSYGAQRTMKLAQSLYESGYITYMRTDSTNISADALSMVRSCIDSQFGKRYLPEKPNFYSSSNKSAQEAHEAIRPTDTSLTPEAARAKLGHDDSRLYDLIWRRFVASQMTPAEFDQTSVTIAAKTHGGDAVFRATGRKLVFDGFMKVAGVTSEDQLLPELAERQPVWPIEIDPTQHFTQPPPRFTEASLVKMLEQLGIGRPSTYASIIQTIQDRKYVEQQDRRFFATLLGSVVTDKLIQAFPEIMNVQFTAGMEGRLDAIEDKHQDWVKLLQEFYGPFHKTVEGALGILEHAGGASSPYKCPKCGKEMLYRISKTGFFLACSDKECKTTQPVDAQGKPTLREVSEFKCPVCGREMIKRRGRFGEFLGCSGYSVKNEKGEPSCTTIINLDKEGKPLAPKVKIETTIACEKCGNKMVFSPRHAVLKPRAGVARMLDISEMPKHQDDRQADRRGPETSRGVGTAAQRRIQQGPRTCGQGGRRQPRDGRRHCPDQHRHRHRLRRMRQAHDHPLRPPRQVPGMQRIPQVQKHRRGTGQAHGRTGPQRQGKAQTVRPSRRRTRTRKSRRRSRRTCGWTDACPMRSPNCCSASTSRPTGAGCCGWRTRRAAAPGGRLISWKGERIGAIRRYRSWTRSSSSGWKTRSSPLVGMQPGCMSHFS